VQRADGVSLIAVGLLCAGLLVGCDLATVRQLDPATGKAILPEATQAFDAASFVTESWDARILPTIRERAVDLATLNRERAADSAGAAQRYGTGAGSGRASFLVTGLARVVEVDTTSRSGVARLDLEPADGTVDAELQVGPVFRGTALRDALPFIRFDDFKNQMEYASVSRLLHERVGASVLPPAVRGDLVGRVMRFHGAFTEGSRLPLITPVIVQVEAGS
jgi:predicted lipoprotein